MPTSDAAFPAPDAAPFRRAVVAAAGAVLPLLGSGNGDAVDAMAVAAMRAALTGAAVDGRVVVGEGEKDDAPMLHLGERFGAGPAGAVAVGAVAAGTVDAAGAAGHPAIDIAVDPVDGTRLAAAGLPGAMAVIAAVPRGGFFDLGPAHYLDKLVTWVPGITAADASADAILAAVPSLVARAAELRGVAPSAVRVAVQDRPRNRDHIAAVRAAGAAVEVFENGDVERSLRALHGAAASARAADERERGVPGLDAVIGIGGAPEGVIVAAGARALGGSMLARFAPQSAGERSRVLAHLGGAGRPAFDGVFDLDALCSTPAELLVAAVTDCEIGIRLPGARAMAAGVRVHWWAAGGRHSGWADLLEAHHSGT
ncbi:fructose-bisphosphatase class II [Agromyces laixinhei]|uniref:fructose-bisphosphatase class II n=1 Tax=Agromyces laixinhei TaxID=2585717 RepID=UPI0018DCAE65|nr:fructose-bisphosphatase class II [Agromyces laixinhei]